ncbi:MAG: hypothetical protein OXD54_03685 [Candidatus Poribacteria bacterium]|nr:hypothetical protein [Candidatus Poribacteria bacterium]
MKQYSRYLALAGGIIAFFSFALPWVGIYSGVELAIDGLHASIFLFLIFLGFLGFGIYQYYSMSLTLGTILIFIGFFCLLILLQVLPVVVKEHGGSPFITFAFFTSLVIIGVSILLNRQDNLHAFSRVFLLINSCIGLCCFLIVVFSLNFDLKIAGTLNSGIKYGAFLTAIGFILPIVGVFESQKRSRNPDTISE